MAQKKLTEYVRALFTPLAKSAGQDPKNLYTQDLPQDRKEEQFKRFKELQFDTSRVVPLPGGGFVAVGTEADDELLLVSAPSLNDVELEELEDSISSTLKFEPMQFDEAMLLVASKELADFLRLKPELRKERAARDVIGIADDKEYAGHSIYDLQGYYNDVKAFRIPNGSADFRQSISSLGLSLLTLQTSLCSPIIDRNLSAEIIALRGGVGCSDSDLFQALTANQWRYAFLDIYRCLESLYFFPWMRLVRDEFGLSPNIFSIRDKVRSSLDWKSKEDISIAKLFELIDVPSLSAAKDKLGNFTDLDPSETPRTTYAGRVYSARNMAVHFEDRNKPRAVAPAPKAYYELTLFLCEFLADFNRCYAKEFP